MWYDFDRHFVKLTLISKLEEVKNEKEVFQPVENQLAGNFPNRKFDVDRPNTNQSDAPT